MHNCGFKYIIIIVTLFLDSSFLRSKADQSGALNSEVVFLLYICLNVHVLICVRDWTCYCCCGDGGGCHGSGLDLYR